MVAENIHESARSLFEYIKEVCQLTQQKVLDVEKQPGFIAMRELDDPACIKLFSRDRENDAMENESDTLLTFRKPDFTPCPAPDASLEQWLVPGWQDYRKALEHLAKIEVQSGKEQEQEGEASTETLNRHPISDAAEQDQQDSQFDKPSEEAVIEYFTDDPERVHLYDQWAIVREKWVKREKHTARIRDLFNDLFSMYNQYRQRPDALEIVVGNGCLTDRDNKAIRHPLFTKRVDLKLDPVTNTLIVTDTDEPACLNRPLLSSMDDINVDIIAQQERKAEEENIHPLDHYDGGNFLKSIAHQLHASSRYVGDHEEVVHIEERIIVRWEPYIILRKRPDGTIKAIQSIEDALAQGAEIPGSLVGILGGFDETSSDDNSEGIMDRELNPISDYDASGWQLLEDEDILLPKPANKEQMEIVRQIEHTSAVLVQGPPGTGKTHTIANLLGHFLAQGKTVLVTSHTSKALTVLKEKVPENLRALCVEVFGDNRADMEASIDAIIERTSRVSLHTQSINLRQLQQQRHETLFQLRRAHDLVYAIRHKEFEPIVYEGDSWSPSKAAEYVAQRESLIELIPGDVRANAPLPLSQQELEWLYSSNMLLTAREEEELAAGLPDIEELMPSTQISEGVELLGRLNTLLRSINSSGQVSLSWDSNQCAVIDRLTNQVFVGRGNDIEEESIRKSLRIYEESIPGWAVFAMSDGTENDLPRKRWEQMLNLIEEAYAKEQTIFEKLLKRPIQVIKSSYDSLLPPYKSLLDDAKKHGYVKKSIFSKKEKNEALDSVTIGGEMPKSLHDIESIVIYLELLRCRDQLSLLWDNLVASHGGRKFAELGDDPERKCHQQVAAIDFWLSWDKKARIALCNQAKDAGIGESILLPISSFGSLTDEKAAQILHHITEQLVPAVHMHHLIVSLHGYTQSKANTLKVLARYQNSSICRDIQLAVDEDDADRYELAINQLASLLKKAEVQKHRDELLNRIDAYAPHWSMAIRNREGCHGSDTVPNDIQEAWKVKQLAHAVNEIINTPLSDAQKRVSELTIQFRKDTEKLATAQAWHYLQKRVDANPSIRQSLNGWKQTNAKIGKGTGKRAPALRAEARKLMMKCQKAVPAWIMPVSSVMNTIDPAATKFDVVIVDEASQSDITASAILYMGKKIIIVGDDEQVSPMAVGLDEDKMQNLMTMLIKDRIPNAHLWDAKTSLYDIAAQVYRPLMLREHFRCVPDIIGYSNMLSYRGRIKPLREAGSSPFKTATISYRVHGKRNGRAKTNLEEADAIVALIKACLEQTEYADKSIGVISMLGDDQANLISRKLADAVPLSEYEKHRILCGNPSSLQGDERDIIFLSLVDSNESDGPLSLASGEGQGSSGKAMKQRYNVAVSRAKDQLWVVHSLDTSADLKPGDMRRRLLEYVSDPQSTATQSKLIEDASDSPFESEVATALTSHGYHIVQQWPVGAYRIDMVAIFENKRIAIECDGERWHSGEDQIRSDMERQSILERLGWKFIRIRGSEYYRGKDQTISRVIAELEQYGIHPESSVKVDVDMTICDPLLQKIKQRAMQLMEKQEDMDIPSTPIAGPVKTATAVVTPSLSSEPIGEKLPTTAHADEASAQVIPPRQFAVQLTMEMPDDSTTRQEEMHGDKRLLSKNTASEKQRVEMHEDVLVVLQRAGFTCVDNRSKSNILWVLYDAAKETQCKEILRKYGLEPRLERRGALATEGKIAWRIKTS